MANNLPGLLNVALCSFIVPTLFFYRRRDSRHKPLVSLLAWLLMTVYALPPLAFLCGTILPGNRSPSGQWLKFAGMVGATDN
ncbi:phage holin family protein [Escherichia coli]|nr:phage holin family protein [Escherichia coli]